MGKTWKAEAVQNQVKSLFSLAGNSAVVISEEGLTLTCFFPFTRTLIIEKKLPAMADFKRRTLLLSTGKQIKLFGNSIAIGKSLEIGEGYAPNIFSCVNEQTTPKQTGAVANPYELTAEEIVEVTDYTIQLWMDLKANLRKHGVNSSKIFNQDAIR